MHRLKSITLVIAVIILGGQSYAVAQTQAPSALVQLGVLPQGWTSQTNVMDSIWKPLGLTGTNYYAFGAPVTPHRFASRSDPSSALYQAWFGVYATQGAGDIFSSPAKSRATVRSIAHLDQISWLGAMGDPKPTAKWLGDPTSAGTMLIAGVPRDVYMQSMQTDSDFSPPGPRSTGLAKLMGMPGGDQRSVPIEPFHPLVVRGYFSSWYDKERNKSFVVYAVASSFTADNGNAYDNFPALSNTFKTMMQSVNILH